MFDTLIDYHVHTALSSDARGEILDCIKAALNKNLGEIGISDHYAPKVLKDKLGDLLVCENLSDYVKKVNQFKKNWKGPVKLKLGVEVDFIPNLENEIKNEIKGISFDYVIGSVHFIENWGFDNPKHVSEYQKWDIMKLYERYFTLVQACAKSQIFDIIGHPDLIKKFGYRPKTSINDLYSATAKVFKENNVCIEVNTSGLQYPCKEIYPNKQFLKICYDEGVQITFGSDAHKPEDVGINLDKALNLVKEVGYERIATFTGRKKQLVEI